MILTIVSYLVLAWIIKSKNTSINNLTVSWQLVLTIIFSWATSRPREIKFSAFIFLANLVFMVFATSFTSTNAGGTTKIVMLLLSSLLAPFFAKTSTILLYSLNTYFSCTLHNLFIKYLHSSRRFSYFKFPLINMLITSYASVSNSSGESWC